jgi:hypothetical protein
VGAGRQQVRFLWAGVGSLHLCPWAFTPAEAWAWGGLRIGWWTGRRRRGAARRAGPARRAWRREPLGGEIRAAPRAGANDAGITATAERLLNLAA